jgi:hypothetical protein
MQHAENGIMLSPAAWEQLKQLPPGALKVYLYFSSRNEGHPIRASIPEIAEIGLGQRSVIYALQVLEERRLITRTVRRGNRPNVYRVLPIPVQITSPASGKTAPPEAPNKAAAIEELIAGLYRPLRQDEMAAVKECVTDESDLRARLEKMQQLGSGVAPEMELGFFCQVMLETPLD